MNKPTVTIGIAAYNEESNIRNLLLSILSQNARNYSLEKIIVLSDGSSDMTVSEASGLSDVIQVMDSRERKGKNNRINELLSMNGSDIFVQFDADCLLTNKNVISELVNSFQADPKVDLVCGDHLPLAPQTFGEQVALFGNDVWREMLEKSGNMSFRCVGQIRAFSARLAGSLRLPENTSTNEDTYSYFYAVANNYKVIFNPNAVVYFKLPDTVMDYLRQLRRTIGHGNNIVKYFDKELVARHSFIDPALKFGILMRLLRGRFLSGACFILVQLAAKFPIRSHSDGMWAVSDSTKQIKSL